MYPEDCPQSIVGPWWQADSSGSVVRGRLILAFIPYPEMKPFRLIPEGRGDDPRQHQRATFSLEAFRVGDAPRLAGTLPVAALPRRPGEDYFVVRGKVRPAVVLGTGGDDIPRTLRAGTASWLAARTYLVAPYYGADQDGTRGGWPVEFVDRIRHAEYPQYVWDMLPLRANAVSILRLDHLLSIGSDPANFVVQPHVLTTDALIVLDEWIDWVIKGAIPARGILTDIRGAFIPLGS